MKRMQEIYKTEIAPALVKELGVSNVNATPRVVKIVVSVGVGKLSKDSKMLEAVESTLTRITGQKPVAAKARVSISNFKLREGQVVGYKVTLRGVRMWDFLQKLVHITFARVRDFRGISIKHVDDNGNMSIGFKEHLPFPEIRNDELDTVHGIEVTIHTTAGNKKNGQALFRALGFPFKEGVK
ncbi:MAG: 50S ribosomal protein L5 [Candidatus Magasanikbacteria bacterium RIFCSPHIGHO2_01_FULL_50_8]|uniref:Large ribosomal subunit protein uL5 n=2 Tax=Candidatus Magasanikiibacteriota TaxID=1752731 RepID=A0A1F6LR54_9BACT|nr:MAG: 50S ribosomal protein L5 [Candidatus Magasanikbacteria bacterium RIFCSPHIGHO2_01_FULL_50_8]OGH67433.1 MAG: 50S ribosomal protein L5 [Candidatus Magasanikbacteria bacterium RIFCSPHIGHO2_02_FULL_50_9b]